MSSFSSVPVTQPRSPGVNPTQHCDRQAPGMSFDTRQPRHRHATVHAPPSRRLNGNDDQYHAHASNSSLDPYQQGLANLQLTPPPPYNAGLAHEYTSPPMPTPAFYQQPAQSQQSLSVWKGNKLKKKSSAWSSAKELAKQAQPSKRSPYGNEPAWKSCVDLVARPMSRSRLNECPVVGTLIQSSALCDRVTAVINDALHDAFSSLDHEQEEYDSTPEAARGVVRGNRAHPLEKMKGGSIIDFKKTWLYSNSRLPPHMPPLKLYLDTWQLVCSAAKASLNVYRRPRKEEQQDYIEADWRAGTKAMIMNSRPVDDKNLIVISIRGSKWNVFDWAVNFRPAPTEPIGFLDDEGNACHAGFLRVSRSMIKPVAARLRGLLEQNPSRAASSLLFTGHSAGGAVAQLLFLHMMTTNIRSELNVLNGCFRRVHCVTFGVPPVSLLPLSAPGSKKFRKNLFLSFVNEGDPVVRADQQYLSTLTRLIASSAPTSGSSTSQDLKIKPLRWEVPPATLSCGGRLVLLRHKPADNRLVEAVTLTDGELRDVVFGDVSMHSMETYKRRIDGLAIAAVTGRHV